MASTARKRSRRGGLADTWGSRTGGLGLRASGLVFDCLGSGFRV